MNKRASTFLLQRCNKTTSITWKTSAHLLCAPCRHIYRGGRRHHADMSVVVPITLSCWPRVLPGHKDTWNISTTDIATGTDTDFVGVCTPALILMKQGCPPLLLLTDHHSIYEYVFKWFWQKVYMWFNQMVHYFSNVFNSFWRKVIIAQTILEVLVNTLSWS